MSDIPSPIPESPPGDALRTPIHDALLAAGHDGLAAECVGIADYLSVIGRAVQRANLAGERIERGDVVVRGADELLYKFPMGCRMGDIVGACLAGVERGEGVTITRIDEADTRGPSLLRGTFEPWLANNPAEGARTGGPTITMEDGWGTPARAWGLSTWGLVGASGGPSEVPEDDPAL